MHVVTGVRNASFNMILNKENNIYQILPCNKMKNIESFPPKNTLYLIIIKETQILF